MSGGVITPGLTGEDQTLVNMAGCFLFDAPDRDDMDLRISIIRDLLPKVRQEHRLVNGLALACSALIDAWPSREVRDDGEFNAYFRARRNLAPPLAAIFVWRADEAWSRLQDRPAS